MSTSERTSAGRSGISWPIMIAVIVFFALAGVFAYMLLLPDRVASTVPSALIGRQAPETPLPAIEGLTTRSGAVSPGLDPAMLEGSISIVNVWGSWCAPCRQEHPYLMQLAEDERIQIIGLNYKDKPENAIRFLRQLGNPFDAVGADDTGRAAIEWGVYGVPETFIVAPDRTIAYKHVGPISADILERTIVPEIDKLAAAEASPGS
ncbi:MULTISPECIES: DsbE family thiol:disulfide interchange protein [unclassified Roseitalea]|uniref:DsbE family thiol:disulfide interchange protein n=1 Tax=unclassified Roseitalea TaxID=2639107 RepID=UPI0027402A67|nr:MULTISPECIES: DsbE family thiol:disulfide interchange protein [unclassified Roseitalea]